MLGLGLNVSVLHDEADRRYLACRLSIVEDIYLRVSQERDTARAPIPDPPSIAKARAFEEKARKTAGVAVTDAEEAKGRRDTLVARTPSGWRLAWWWADGRWQRYRVLIAKAEASARAAHQMAVAHAQVVAGAAFAVEVEIEKAATWRRAEVQRRRHAEASASLRMERARIAADLLRENPTHGALPVPDLFRRAEAIRLKREAMGQSWNEQDAGCTISRPGRP